MKATSKRPIVIMATVFTVATCVTSHRIIASEIANGDLLALERRALQAQSLLNEVNKLKAELVAAEKRQRETETRIEILKQSEQVKNKEISRLEDNLAEAKELIKQRDSLLKIFRSGAFEYYEVQDGDTLEGIAANPMVYGDKNRAPWIALVNGLQPDAAPPRGSVLIIPRYTEGASYDF